MLKQRLHNATVNCSTKSRWLAVMAMATILINGPFTRSVCAQTFGNPFSNSTASPIGQNGVENAPLTIPDSLIRQQLALDVAMAAAESGSPALSLEAVRRSLQQVRLTDSVTAGRNATSISVNAAASTIDGNRQVSPRTGPQLSHQALIAKHEKAFIDQLFEITKLWEKQQFDASQVTDTLLAAVLPESPANEVRLFAEKRSSPESFLQSDSDVERTKSMQLVVEVSTLARLLQFREPTIYRSLAFQMVGWAAKADRLKEVIEKLEARVQQPRGGDGYPVLIYALRLNGQTDRVAELVASLAKEGKLPGTRVDLIVQAAAVVIDRDHVKPIAAAAVPLLTARNLEDSAAGQALELALRYDLVNLVPYFQFQIIQHISTNDVVRLNQVVDKLVGLLKLDDDTRGAIVADLAWDEIYEESIKRNRPVVSLHAIRRRLECGRALLELPARMPTSDIRQSSLKAHAAVCELPVAQRFETVKTLILDCGPLTCDAFQILAKWPSDAPEYFRSTRHNTAINVMQPYADSYAMSLLDLLLSDAQQLGKLDAVVDQLMDAAGASKASLAASDPKAAQGSDPTQTIRLLCDWLTLRAEYRQEAVPARVVKERRELADSESMHWWTGLSEAAVVELAKFRSRSIPLKSVFRDAVNYANSTGVNGQSLLANINRSQVRTGVEQPWSHWLMVERLSQELGAGAADTRSFDSTFPVENAWALDEGKRLLPGYPYSGLMLKYPLGGDYALQFKAHYSKAEWRHDLAGGVIDGVLLEFRDRTARGNVDQFPVMWGRLTGGRSNMFRLGKAPSRSETSQIECAYRGKTLSFSIDGVPLAHAAFDSQAFPFVALVPLGPEVRMSEIELKGKPTILDSVTLLDSSLNGWSAAQYFYPMKNNTLDIRPADMNVDSALGNPGKTSSWRYEVEELRADKMDDNAPITVSESEAELRKQHNSRLYSRPLQSGESFEYEFLHAPGQSSASPVVGQVAFMFEEGKVRLHWLPSVRDIACEIIALDNRADDPEAEQLAAYMLKPNDWNHVSLRLSAEHLIIAINGTDVYRRPIGSLSDSRFGWYYNPTQGGVRIRHARLTGDWPQELPGELMQRKSK